MRDARLGEPSYTWCYRDADGRPSYRIARYDTPQGKQIRPWTWDGSRWQQRAYPAPRPLYGLDRLARMPDAPVLVCEGEKCADAAHVALGAQYICMAWAGGAAAVRRSDWSPLRGRRVLVWPDRDDAGRRAAEDIRRVLPQAEVLEVPGDDGWDVADLLDAEGAEAARRFVAECLRIPAASDAERAQRKDEPPTYLDDVPPPEGATQAPAGSAAGAPKTRNIVDLSLWADRDPPAFPWIIPHWLSWHPTLLAALGGMGKTLLLLEMAVALAAGRAFLGPARERTRVLLWLCEDDDIEIWRRLSRICRHMKLSIRDLPGWLTIDARRGLENTLYTTEYGRPMWTPLIEELRLEVNDYRADVLVLDNIAQVFGANPNAPHDTTAFVNGIDGLVRDRPFCPLLTGHTSRAQGSEYSGSAAWENAVRMRWYLGDRLPDEPIKEGEEPDGNVRFLCKRKANYSAKDYVRFTFDKGVLVPEQIEEGEIGVMAALRARKAQGVVLDGLRKLSRLGLTCSHAPGGNYLPKMLMEHELHEGLTRRELQQAMAALLKAERIKRAELGAYDGSRHPRYGLVEVPT
ncbi:MAG: AAA family ATPase [Betaproteobacteria bacterium]|nr:AAA family ATPase [Betaproteobacteria bacterium]